MSEEQAPAPACAGGEPVDWRQEQARRYLEVAYGADWLYTAPETLSPHGQWIWAVANGERDFGERSIAKITAYLGPPPPAGREEDLRSQSAGPLARREASLRAAGVPEGTIRMMRP